MTPTSDEICARMRRELRFFHFLAEDDLTDVAAYFSCRQLKAGEILWREGDAATEEAFIVAGRVEVKKETEFAGKQVVIGVYSAGTIVGEISILDDKPRAVTAVALQDTDLLLLSRENFEKLLTEHPERGVKLLKGMLLAVSTRLRKAFDRLASIF